VLIGLEARGWTGKAVAVSRHGLLPEPHHRATGPAAAEPPEKTPLSEALNSFRRRAETTAWPRLIDEIRPHLQALWMRMDVKEQQRFLRHLRSWWEVRRHRLAPDVAQRMTGLKAEGRLRVFAAKVAGASRQGEQLLIDIRPRGGQALRTVTGAWLINCTGPAGGMAETDDPLIASLFADGTARPDALGLGVDVDRELRLKTVDGRSHERLFALGPLPRGVLGDHRGARHRRARPRAGGAAGRPGRELAIQGRALARARPARRRPRLGRALTRGLEVGARP
jgi:uncharacterized NAD(P)/FAD-binding protein YdhS